MFYKVIATTLLLAGCTAQYRPPPTPPIAPVAQAQEPVPAPVVPPMDAEFLDPTSPEVRKAFDKYVETGKAPIIVKKTSGFVQWPFGLSQPTMRCRILESCRIELEPGEIVRDVGVGDSSRWVWQRGRSGPEGNITTHVMAKPTDYVPDVQTTLTIFTDRRVYEIRLISILTGPMVRAKFWYPEDMIEHVNSGQEAKPIVAPKVDMAKVLASRSRYEIEGDRELQPVLLGDDEVRTYFLMPQSLHSIEAPVLFALSPNGKRTQVNYRLVSGTYTADKIFDRAVLVWGVGADERIVTISRRQS